MASNRQIEDKLNRLSERIGHVWPRNDNARSSLTRATLNEAVTLINRAEGMTATASEAVLDAAERLAKLAEAISQHDRAMALAALALFQQVNKLWSAVASNFPPDKLAQVVAMDERLRDDRKLAQIKPLLALANLSERLAAIVALAEENNVVIEAALCRPPPADMFADLNPENAAEILAAGEEGLAEPARLAPFAVSRGAQAVADREPDDGIPIDWEPGPFSD